jgi:predicted nucleotidyltransferase
MGLQDMYNDLWRKLMDYDQIQQFVPELFEIARKHGISKIHVFGSAARGESSSQSDIDFLVAVYDPYSATFAMACCRPS